MARDRKRAKQRQGRRVRQGAAAPGSEPFRRDLPGSLQHSSGDVDEFDAALVRGAQSDLDGAPAEPEQIEHAEPEAESGVDREQPPADAEPVLDVEPEPEAHDDEFEDEDEVHDDDELELAGAPSGGGGGGVAPPTERAGRAPVPGGGAAPARVSLAGRAAAFLRASWAELQRVQWPDRRQVAQATAVVLGFVAIAGIYLGVADWVAQKIVDAIL